MIKDVILIPLVFSVLYSQPAWAMGSIMWERLWEQVGRFHYLILHFPIVLICLLPLVLAVSSCGCLPHWRKTVATFFHLSTLSALAATSLGLILASATDRHDDLAMSHRTWALVTCGLMLAASSYLIIRKPNLEQRVPYVLWGFALAAALTLTVAADTGGTMVHDKLIILFG